MSGNGIIIILVAALAAFSGMAWERARRALYDLRRTRKAIGLLRETAQREQGRAALYVIIAVVVILFIASHS